MPRPGTLSRAAARRIALAAQGFGAPRAPPGSWRPLGRTLDRIALHQIDSVNVLVRAHYLPAFSRLGAYDRGLLDRAAWGARRERRLFEYWGHEASLLPLALHPLLRWRMDRADRGEAGWTSMRRFAGERRAEAMALLGRIRDSGPMAASDFDHGRSRSGWWEWGAAKQALEWLFWAGHLTAATRRASFERVYDIPERVLPRAILGLPTPSEPEAHRALIEIAARALGVATAGDLRDYFRLKPGEAKAAIDALVEDGILLPVKIEGWRQGALLHAAARHPRQISGQALLAPFDPLIWERGRAERLFGFHYRIEIYTPAAKRRHGYYVLPFLMDEALVARVDLKADRKASRLLARGLHLEPGAPPDTRERLVAELERVAGWLGMEQVSY
jgi:uncharacterized protein YcaQ